MIADLMSRHGQLGPNDVVLDYGCGIGRMAKELILRHNCRVIGVDISPNMRALSVQYVNSDNFFACPPAMLGVFWTAGFASTLLYRFGSCSIASSRRTISATCATP